MLWTDKYYPKNIKDLFHPCTSKIIDFLDNFKSQKKKALLIYGLPGSGKTCAVHVIAKEKNLELIEVNASDFRNADKINEKVGNAVKQRSLFAKDKIILVDEVDGLAGREDRGGISALVGLIKKSSFPVVCTANNPWDSKFSSLRSVCSLVLWSAPNYLSINKLLKNILKKEGVDFDESVVKSIARRCGGDVRGAVTDVHVLSGSQQLTSEGVDSISDRAQTETMFQALIKILKSSDPVVALAALNNVEEDINASMLWIEENLPLEYKGKELADAFDKLSRADVFIGRIRRWQHWRYLSYAHDLISAGVSVSKDSKKSGFTKFQPPKRILKYWMAKSKKALRRSVAQKLANKIHCSEKKANEMLYHVKFWVNHDANIDFLDLSSEELDWLKAE